MSKSKRFELAYGTIEEINKNGEIIDVLTDDEVVELLNSLNEENEQLRQILKNIVVATDETYTKNTSMFKVTVVLDYEKYREIKECLYE